MIRIATEKSLQSDVTSLKTNKEFANNWQQLLIMYQSRYEKRLAWKEKSKDFEKIEEALEEQEKKLKTTEEKLPKPIKIKTKKKEKDPKPKVKRSKEAVVYVLDLENKTAEPLGNETIEDEPEEKEKIDEQTKPMETETEPPSSTSSATVISDPFFLNSQHQITYQKRTTKNQDDVELDDKSFIEHSYFIDALSSSSNRRDGKGKLAKQKWAHLTPPSRPRPTRPTNSKVNGMKSFIISREKKQKSFY